MTLQTAALQDVENEVFLGFFFFLAYNFSLCDVKALNGNGIVLHGF